MRLHRLCPGHRVPWQPRVAIGTYLEKAGMCGLASRHWPKQSLVDNLGHEVSKQKKAGVDSPFIYCDMRKWAPEWAIGSCDEEPVEEPANAAASRDIHALAEAISCA